MTDRKILICAAALFLVLVACSPAAKLYRDEPLQTGKLSASQFDSLRSYLKAYSPLLNDTLIIKYEFDKESCWDNLDQQDEDRIKATIKSRQEFQKNALATRKGISIFHFKEKGNSFNKIVKWDGNIIEDGGFLRRYLFFERTVCGTSAVVLPNGDYYLKKSDAHFTLLYDTVIK